MASAMGIWNVATAIPQVVAPPLVTAPLIRGLDARSPGLGPRGAIVLAILELTLGALWLWRLSAAGAVGGGGRGRSRSATPIR